MPIHEYQCQECQYIFEYISVLSTDSGPHICPSCKTVCIQRIISKPIDEFKKWPILKRRLPPELKKFNK